VSRRRSIALVAAGAGAVALVAARRTEAKWSAAHDPSAAEDYLIPHGESITVVTDDGAQLAVTVAGPEDGAPVVLAHGWACGREVWAPVAHRLIRSGHRVALYDQRGHGASTVGSDPITVERLGADLAAVLEHLDVDDAVLAGHSMGGMTVQAAAVHAAEVVSRRAKAIVLVSTAGAGIGDGGADERTVRLVKGTVADRALRSPLGRFLVRGAVGKRVVTARHLDITKDLFVALDNEVRGDCLRAMLDMDLREGLRDVDLPATVLIGSGDKLISPKRAEETATAVRGAALVTLDGFGHMLPLESPDTVAEHIAGHAAG
jgi:pimeloyl-ACP methyl ester carboxylesterase